VSLGGESFPSARKLLLFSLHPNLSAIAFPSVENLAAFLRSSIFGPKHFRRYGQFTLLVRFSQKSRTKHGLFTAMGCLLVATATRQLGRPRLQTSSWLWTAEQVRIPACVSRLNREAVRLLFTPGWRRVLYPLDSVENCQVIQNAPMQGMAIQVGFTGGWILKVLVPQAVALQVHGRRTLRIGTDQPERLATSSTDV
jgi:hypothetical protein